jgi:hypothetical protein
MVISNKYLCGIVPPGAKRYNETFVPPGAKRYDETFYATRGQIARDM